MRIRAARRAAERDGWGFDCRAASGGPIGFRAVGSPLEHLLQLLLVFWQLPARLPADDERHQQPADAAPSRPMSWTLPSGIRHAPSCVTSDAKRSQSRIIDVSVYSPRSALLWRRSAMA
jgi:hypothetical protein